MRASFSSIRIQRKKFLLNWVFCGEFLRRIAKPLTKSCVKVSQAISLSLTSRNGYDVVLVYIRSMESRQRQINFDEIYF
jgi:hypothetical protein